MADILNSPEANVGAGDHAVSHKVIDKMSMCLFLCVSKCVAITLDVCYGYPQHLSLTMLFNSDSIPIGEQ